MSATILEEPRTRPTSTLVYARSRAELDPVLADLGSQTSETAWWIEVVDSTVSAAHAAPDLARPRYLEFEPAELLPERGLSHLAHWIAGRGSHDPLWVEEAEAFAWLPPALRTCLTRPASDGTLAAIIVAPAERLVPRFARGLDDVRELLATLGRLRVSVVAGLLVRPLPEFAALFDYVIRVRPPTSRFGSTADLVIERRPSAGPSPTRYPDRARAEPRATPDRRPLGTPVPFPQPHPRASL